MSPPRALRVLLTLSIISTNIFFIHAASILGLFISDHRSHLLVYTAVVRLLLERGHNVTMITTLNIEQLSDGSYHNLRHIQLNASQADRNVHNAPIFGGLQRVQRVIKGIEEKSSFLNQSSWHAFLQESNRFDLLLLGYLFNDYQLGVAAHFDCPVVAIWTGQPIGFVNRLLGNPEERSYVTQPYDRHQRSGMQALALGIFEHLIDAVALDTMERVYNQYFPAPSYPSFWHVRKNISVVLCNHHSLSEGPIAPYLPTLVDIGGIQSQPMSELMPEIAHLNGSELIFLSFGTREKWSNFPKNTVNIFLEAFQHFPQYTIYWTYDGDCQLLTAAAANIKCSSWWPQTALLAQPTLKLFITHGGKGSISEAQFHGVPMLGIPMRGDQLPNVERLVALGFGLRLDLMQLTADELKAALQELSGNRTYRANVQRFSRLYRDRPLTAQQTAIYWIEYVLRHKGAAHLRSARLHLNAFQYQLLDIYAALVLCFVCFVVVARWLERWLH